MPINDDLENIDKVLSKAESTFEEVAAASQKDIYNAILKTVANINTVDGAIDRMQNPTKHIAGIQKIIDSRLKGDYTKGVSRYFDTVIGTGDEMISMHENYNGLGGDEKEKTRLEQIRKVARNDLEQKLTDTLLPDGDTFRQSYSQPIKNLVFQKIRQGASMTNLQKSLEDWNAGNAPIAGVKPLQSYTTQIARDASFQHNGQINQIISDEFELNAWEYSGGIIASSRPLCVHLVKMDRPVLKTELPALLKRYPDGLIKGTNAENFGIYRGGYACRHQAFPVRVNENALKENKPSKPEKKKKAGPIPSGKPVSEAFTDIPKKVKTPVTKALKIIDDIHGDGTLQQIPIKVNKHSTQLGAFRHNTVTHQPHDILLSELGAHKESTIVHEIGHYLDFETIGTRGEMSSAKPNSELKDVLKAAKNTTAIKKIEGILANSKYEFDGIVHIVDMYDEDYLKYLKSETEIWARAYTQFIAKRSGNKKMTDAIANTLTRKFPTQWDDKDFEDLEKEIEKLFVKKGWISLPE